MSRYKDDGTFSGGIFTAMVIVAAFVCGYALRDSGFQFSIKQPQQQEVRRP